MGRLFCGVLFLPVCLASVAAAGQQAGSPTSPVLSLDEATSRALEHNRTLAVERLEVDKSRQRTDSARSRYKPEIDIYALGTYLLSDLEFTFDEGVFGDFPTTGPIPPTSTAITTPAGTLTGWVVGSVTQPLTQLHRIGLGVDAARLQEEAGEERLRREEHEVVFAVRRAYYGLLQTDSRLRAATETLDFHEELLRVVRGSVERGTALDADALEIEARKARVEHRILRLDHQRIALREEMNRLLGEDLDVDFRVEPLPPAEKVDVDLAAARSVALDQRPEVREAQIELERAEIDRRITSAERYPDLSLSVDYTSAFNVDFLPRNVLGAGLLLSWEPFTWGRRRNELSVKVDTVEQSRHRVHAVRTRVSQEVGQRLREMEEARSLLEVSRLARRAGEEQRRIALQLYERQGALLRDVLEAEAALADAEDEYQRAQLGVWLAQAQLDHTLGASL